MARAPDLRRCRCNLRLRYLRYLRFPFLASMRYPTRHDPCGKRFRRNSALRAVHTENNRGRGCIIFLCRLGEVQFKLCVSPPADLDGLSPSQLKELVASLLEKMAELERKNAEQREEIARLKGLKRL